MKYYDVKVSVKMEDDKGKIKNIGEQYLIGLNKLYYLQNMEQVIEFYNINNILSETPDVWNHYSQNWVIVLEKENAKFKKYLKNNIISVIYMKLYLILMVNIKENYVLFIIIVANI